MPFFTKSSPLDTAVAARSKLRARLDAVDLAITAKTVAISDLALAGADDAALDTAEAELRNLFDRKRTLTAALAEADAQIAKLEAEHDEALDHAERSATVAEFDKKLKETEAVEKELFAAIGRMSAVTGWAAMYVPEAGGVQGFLTAAKQQLPDAMALIRRCLREHAAAILRHDAPAKLRNIEAPVPVVVKLPELRQAFTAHPITWRDHKGDQRVSGKWLDVELPVGAAVFALKAKLVILPTDERTKKLRGLSQGHPEPGWLNDLDTKIGPNIPAGGGNGSTADPIRASSPFTVIDRGPAITLKHREAS